MKKYILRKTPQTYSLKRERSLNSEEALRTSTIRSVAERSSEASERRSLKDSKTRPYAKSTKTAPLPYDTFVRQLRIKLPTPREKFYQFLRIAPFNRIQSQNDMIGLFMKHVKFFKLHQTTLTANMARKVKLVQLDEIDPKMMVLVLEGSVRYRGQLVPSGHLISREPVRRDHIDELEPGTRLVAINRHDYLSFLFSFVTQEMIRFREFINGIQTFKMFTEKTIQKFTENMSLHYYLRGEKLYRIGEEASTLFVVYSGMVSRKVIIELQQVNKIPPYAKKDGEGVLLYEKYKRDVRILTKEYEHRIEFRREDMVGVSEIIDAVPVRKEEIEVDEDTILLGIDRSIVEENLDDYISDNLKKYNLKKYPSSYDQLCDNYLKAKISSRRMEERKILAMQNQLRLHHSDRRREKIEFIIQMYQQNIKLSEQANLKKQRLQFQVDKNK